MGPFFVFLYQGLIDQAGKDHRWGGRTYHLYLPVQLFPRRALLDVSELNAGRAWSLGNSLLDLRSAGSPVDVAFPADKRWGSSIFEEYRGDLALASSTVKHPMGEIAIDLALSWVPAHAAITWPNTTATYVRITTRPPAILAHGRCSF